MYTKTGSVKSLLAICIVLSQLFIHSQVSAQSNSLATPEDVVTQKYRSLGGNNGFLGRPMHGIRIPPDGKGRYQYFEGGAIYWHPATGVHEIHGEILNKWQSLRWEQGFLGYPLTDESSTPDGAGRFNHFQGGSIYWHPTTGAHEVHGAIRGKWANLGWEQGFLGYPRTDERITPDGYGRYNHFQGGSIYWTSRTGAHAVDGAILRKWASLGWERSILGYPTSDEARIAGGRGRVNEFQRGKIYWFPETGAYEVYEISADSIIGYGPGYSEHNRVYTKNYGQTFDIPAGDYDGSRISANFNQRSWVPRGSKPVLVRFTIHGVDAPIRQELFVQMKADKHIKKDPTRGPLLYHGKEFYLEYGTDADRGYYFAERSDIKGQHLPSSAYFKLERVFR